MMRRLERSETVATTDTSESNQPIHATGDFGANEWLVEDMYERYQADPNSVDESWHDFFADYRPGTRLDEPAATDDVPPADNAAAPAGNGTHADTAPAAAGVTSEAPPARPSAGGNS